jgi:hypothetical protein
MQAKLEMEAHQMADELDVAKDKASRLAKAEAAVDKYQKKLEEMVTIKKQVWHCYDHTIVFELILISLCTEQGANR